MYINASQQERDLSIYPIHTKYSLCTTIQNIARQILDGIMDDNNYFYEDLEELDIKLENLFEEFDTPSDENAAKLKFLIDNTELVLSEIEKNNKKFNITSYDTPYGLELYISEPNNKFFLTAYSNLDDDMLWDEMIEWVDDLGYNDKL
jgi:hypothetical protein